MGAGSWRLTLWVIAVLSWVVAIVWLVADPGFEPLLAFLTGVASLLGSFAIADRGGEPRWEAGALPRKTAVGGRAGGVRRMGEEAQDHNIAAIRKLLLAAFTPENLRRFCQDRPAFRPVVDRFGPSYGHDDMVDEVIDYCQTRLLFDELLAGIEHENPRQYARFAPNIPATTTEHIGMRSYVSRRLVRLEELNLPGCRLRNLVILLSLMLVLTALAFYPNIHDALLKPTPMAFITPSASSPATSSPTRTLMPVGVTTPPPTFTALPTLTPCPVTSMGRPFRAWTVVPILIPLVVGVVSGLIAAAVVLGLWLRQRRQQD